MSRPPFSLPLLSLLLLLLSSLAANAHMIELGAGKKECFFEDLHAEDKMTVTYQVGGGGHLDIDFWVSANVDWRGGQGEERGRARGGELSVSWRREGWARRARTWVSRSVLRCA